MAERIYMDHAATTRVDPDVLTEMSAEGAVFGNPSSLHADGQRARRVVDHAREVLASALGAEFAEITFTSGGTEANNAALVGVMLANRARGNQLITTRVEHESVLRTCEFLTTLGIDVVYLPSDRVGRIHSEQVREALTEHTVLVSVMHANNEVGTIMPIAKIAAAAHAVGAYLHTDAVQSFGQITTGATLGADLVSVSAHKIYGPKGAGALYVRAGVPIEPLLHGGAQERERRAGTENVAAIAGFGRAVELMLTERDAAAARVAELRDALITELLARVPVSVLNGPREGRLPNNVNVSFPGQSAESILVRLDRAGISASSGSACSSGSIEPSHVLVAMGLDESRIRSAIRFTLGKDSTHSDVRRAAEAMASIAGRTASRNSNGEVES
ncbi:MAG: cysteine desulfurase family protein [Capsulimonadaceae bacterium]